MGNFCDAGHERRDRIESSFHVERRFISAFNNSPIEARGALGQAPLLASLREKWGQLWRTLTTRGRQCLGPPGRHAPGFRKDRSTTQREKCCSSERFGLRNSSGGRSLTYSGFRSPRSATASGGRLKGSDAEPDRCDGDDDATFPPLAIRSGRSGGARKAPVVLREPESRSNRIRIPFRSSEQDSVYLSLVYLCQIPAAVEQQPLFRCCEPALIGSKDHPLREVREELLLLFHISEE